MPPSERFDREREKGDVFALACFEGLSVLPTSGNFQGVSGNGGGSVDCGTLKRVNDRDVEGISNSKSNCSILKVNACVNLNEKGRKTTNHFNKF